MILRNNDVLIIAEMKGLVKTFHLIQWHWRE